MTTTIRHYGYGPYGGDGYKGLTESEETQYHFFALKKLFPVKNMGGDLDNDLTIEGRHLDTLYAPDPGITQSLLPEFFVAPTIPGGPDGATQLLSSWERMFDTTAAGDTTARQNNLVLRERALVNKDQKLNPAYYKAQAAVLGATGTVNVFENISLMFIVSRTSPPATQLPAPLYDSSNIWTWEIDATVVPSLRPAFEAWFLDNKPAFSNVIFNLV